MDGDVLTDGQTLRMQPRGGRWRGASFFVPNPALFAPVQKYIGDLAQTAPQAGSVVCAVTVPGTPLPAGLGLINDGPLNLRLRGPHEPVVTAGDHYTLYAATAMTTAAFEASFDQLMSSCVPCHMEGQAEATHTDLDVDDTTLPSDPRTSSCVMALTELAAATDSPNTRVFASLIARHLAATEVGFEAAVLAFTPAAHMAAAALEVWTVRDPFLLTDACEARDMLALALGIKLSGPKYMPYWVSRRG